MITARDAEDFGETRATTREDVLDWWGPALHGLAEDAWVGLKGDRFAAYGVMRREGDAGELDEDAAVHPELRSREVSAHQVALAEHWSGERGLARVQVVATSYPDRELLRTGGYRPVRIFWRMEVDLRRTEPPRAEPAPGTEIRAYVPGEDDLAVHALHQAAFAEHWQFVPTPFDEWLRSRHERSDYDPALWQLAVDRGGLAGAAICFGVRQTGWVLDLAVAPDRRGRGLGRALLTAGFRELGLRGHTRVALEVDSENATGATRLYERAGMHVTRRFDVHERTLG